MEPQRNVDEDSSDSDSGPDPANEDFDACTIKLNKRSRRQDKRLQKILGKIHAVFFKCNFMPDMNALSQCKMSLMKEEEEEDVLI